MDMKNGQNIKSRKKGMNSTVRDMLKQLCSLVILSVINAFQKGISLGFYKLFMTLSTNLI